MRREPVGWNDIAWKGLARQWISNRGRQAGEVAPDVLMLHACWNAQDITQQVTLPENVRHLVIFCDLPYEEGAEAAIQSRMTGTRCLFLQAGVQDIVARFQSHTARILTEIKNLMASIAAGHTATNLIQVVVSNRDEERPLMGLAGLLQTARLENPRLVGQLLAVDPETEVEALAELVERDKTRLAAVVTGGLGRQPLDER